MYCQYFCTGIDFYVLKCNRVKEGEVMNRIKELREKKGLSIDQLSKGLKAKGISISPASISKYEREERKPKIDKWIKLANFFDVPVSYLQGYGKYNYDDKEAIKKHSESIDKELGFVPSAKDDMHWTNASVYSYRIHDDLLNHLYILSKMYLDSPLSVLNKKQKDKLSSIFDKLGYARQSDIDFNLSMLFYLLLSENISKENRRDAQKVKDLLDEFYRKNFTSSDDPF